MSGAIKDQGMMWVTSRIAQSAKSILDEGTFMRWYDEDHIAEIVQTSGIPDAFRYVNVKKESPLGSEAARKPFLAIYPMQAMEFTQGEEFKKIRVKSDILPGSSVIYDLADIDVEYLGLVSTSGGEAKKGKWQDPTAEIALLTAIVEHAQYILSSATEPASGISDNDVNRFYDQVRLDVSTRGNAALTKVNSKQRRCPTHQTTFARCDLSYFSHAPTRNHERLKGFLRQMSQVLNHRLGDVFTNSLPSLQQRSRVIWRVIRAIT